MEEANKTYDQEVIIEEFDALIEKAKKSPAFTFNAKNGFFTCPHSTVTKEFAMEKLKKVFPKLLCAIVSQETHKDGTPHIHAVFRLKERCHIRNMEVLDSIFGKHGNYMSCRQFRHAVIYVSKQDPKPLIFGDIDVEAIRAALLTKRGVAFESIALKLNAGQDVYELSNIHPGFMLQHLQKVQLYVNFRENHIVDPKLPFPVFSTAHLASLNDPSRRIAEWFNDNMHTERYFGKKQLYVFGPTEMRKSTMLNDISLRKDVFLINNSENFDTGFRKSHQVIVCDEFTGLVRNLQYWNSMVEGGRFNMTQKSLPPVIKIKNIPVIICSNLNPDSAYHMQKIEVGVMNAFKRRFEIVHVTEPLDLKWNFVEPTVLNMSAQTFTNLLCSEVLDADNDDSLLYSSPPAVVDEDINPLLNYSMDLNVPFALNSSNAFAVAESFTNREIIEVLDLPAAEECVTPNDLLAKCNVLLNVPTRSSKKRKRFMDDSEDLEFFIRDDSVHTTSFVSALDFHKNKKNK